jgi:hypothetical protein
MSVIEQEKSRKQNNGELIPKGFRERKHYFSELPLKIQEDIRKSQREVAAGRWVSNEDVFGKIDEWLENE